MNTGNARPSYIHNLSEVPFRLHCGSLGQFDIRPNVPPLRIDSLPVEYYPTRDGELVPIYHDGGDRQPSLDLALRMIGASGHYRADTRDLRRLGLVATQCESLSGRVAARARRRLSLINFQYLQWIERLRKVSGTTK